MILIILLLLASSALAQDQFEEFGAQIDWSHPLAQGLVGWWPLNEGSGGITYDRTFNGNNGTLTNMDPATDWVVSEKGTALDFDGVNDYVEASRNWAPITFTVSFWLNPNNTADFNQTVTAVNSWDSFVFHTTSTGAVYTGITIAGRMSPTELPAGTMEVGVWQHFTLTVQEWNGRFYKNGILLATKNIFGAGGPVAWGGFRIGNTDVNTINGEVMDVRIYDVALTQSQIQQIMVAPFAVQQIDIASLFKPAAAAPAATGRRRIFIIN